MEGLGQELGILNVYGLYSDQDPFWASLLNKQLLRSVNLILGGDLNFSLGEAKVWGLNVHPDNQKNSSPIF